MFGAIFAATTLAFSGSLSSENLGHMVLIGGGSEPEASAKRVIELAGGPSAKIVILSQSRENIARSATAIKEWFEGLGAKQVVAPQTAEVGAILEALKGAKAVFMSGGDQNVFVSRLPETSGVPKAIRAIFASGGVIAGNSAGTSLVSQFMPTGNDPESQADGTLDLNPNSAVVTKGLNIFAGVIVDQHFGVRKRENRLRRILNTVAKSEGKALGIGIEEKAWIEVSATTKAGQFIVTPFAFPLESFRWKAEGAVKTIHPIGKPFTLVINL